MSTPHQQPGTSTTTTTTTETPGTTEPTPSAPSTPEQPSTGEGGGESKPDTQTVDPDSTGHK